MATSASLPVEWTVWTFQKLGFSSEIWSRDERMRAERVRDERREGER
jgi:hypothetical protein